MRRTILCIAFSVVTILGGAAVASAADWCLFLLDRTFVMQNFGKPGKGACKAIVGTRLPGETGDTFPLAGVACQNSTGDHFRIGFTWYAGTTVEEYQVDVALPAQTVESWNVMTISSGGVSSISQTGEGAAVFRVCDPSLQPVP